MSHEREGDEEELQCGVAGELDIALIALAAKSALALVGVLLELVLGSSAPCFQGGAPI